MLKGEKMDLIDIKPINDLYIKEIPKLIKNGIIPKVFPLTIFSCHGYTEYLKLIITKQNNDNIKYYGAFDSDNIVGFSEWRVIEDILFLNNIHIDKLYRNFGIGKKLFYKGIIDLININIKSIELDVFEDSKETFSWYKRMGFLIKMIKYWYLGIIPSIKLKKTINYEVNNLKESENNHKIYGFSKLNIKTQKNIYEIGRINNNIFKIVDNKAIYDNELLFILKKIDPKRKLLLISEHKIKKSDYLEYVTSSFRMHIDTNELLNRV